MLKLKILNFYKLILEVPTEKIERNTERIKKYRFKIGIEELLEAGFIYILKTA